MEKPRNISDYKKWLRNERQWRIGSRTKADYEQTAGLVMHTFENGPFWQELSTRLESLEQQYRLDTGYELLMRPGLQGLLVKPYQSFIIKTFRKNVLENRNWPNEPRGGWFNPNDCLPRINDLVRTTVVVKYLDGVRYVADKVGALANECGLGFRAYYEARPEGYYAAHLYVNPIIEYPRGVETVGDRFSVEIQLTTQLKEVMRQLTHKYYEKRRLEKQPPLDEKWQWNHQSDEFIPNFLGHMLQYLEGMIMQLRERKGGPHE